MGATTAAAAAIVVIVFDAIFDTVCDYAIECELCTNKLCAHCTGYMDVTLFKFCSFHFLWVFLFFPSIFLVCILMLHEPVCKCVHTIIIILVLLMARSWL